MASLSSPARAETAKHDSAQTTEAVLLVAAFGNPVALDYLAAVRRQTPQREHLRPVFAELSEPSGSRTLLSAVGNGRVAGVVLFLSPQLTDDERRCLDELARLAAERGTEFIGIVSSCRVHLEERDAAAAEAEVVARFQGLAARLVVFRPGYILSPNSPTQALLRRFGPCFPLVPAWLRHCFVEGDELFAALERERQRGRPARGRVFTLLGPNRSWHEMLAAQRSRGLVSLCVTALSGLLALLLVGHLVALVFTLFLRRRPTARRWHLTTLRPGSLRELLALYNPYNARHVKVVGYNNGVNHFGQRYPGRTVVSTVNIRRIVRAGPGAIRADCGATIRGALDFLAPLGQELPVVPNFSYVCLGTAFFVPMHGSASDFSTIADTITRVVLYDPVHDRLVTAKRAAPAFRDHLYNATSEMLLLRLTLQVKPRARYFVRREVLNSPGAAEILTALRDQQAANVELRKGKAESSKVGLSRYYTGEAPAHSPALELPRDTLGRLWDRLEENAVTAFLMHAATRHFAWHVELFFTAEEFTTFWEAHRTLPLKKIQLRYVRRDGFPRSPFRDHDCVSVDTFLLRRHRRKLEAFLQRTFPVVRFNPGKHSR